MRGSRTKISHSRIFAAIQQLEERRLLSNAVATVPADWLAVPSNNISEALAAVFPQLVSPQYYGSGDSLSPQGYSPSQIRTAYGSQIGLNGTTLNGAGQTIAIVDAYDDPNALADLKSFDNRYGIADPPSFQKYNDQGQTTPLPTTNGSGGVYDPAGTGGIVDGSLNFAWQFQESLDIEWVHAMAPGANIDLFEASSPDVDLFQTVASAAATPGVTVVTMGWTGREFANETALDSVFTTPAGHAPVTFIAASGDHGAYGYIVGSSTDYASTTFDAATLTPGAFGLATALYPAASSNVVSVGGTTLNLNTDNTYGSETAWGNGTNSYSQGGGGGGISKYEPQPSYQADYDPQNSAYNTPGSFSTNNRVYPDVALDGNPSTGVAVYDSYDFSYSNPLGNYAWAPSPTGGTGLSADLMAGLIADADEGRADNGFSSLDGPSQTLPYLYEVPNSDYRDIITGSTGPSPFQAQTGFDLTSGLGSPIDSLLIPDLANGPEVTGTVFDDANADGILDDGETALRGIDVQILGGADLVVTQVQTSADGTYGFFVDDGVYTIQVTRPTGYYFTIENASGAGLNSNVNSSGTSDSFTVTGRTPHTVNAGLVPTNITVSGLVWNDTDEAPATLPDGSANPLAYLPNGIFDIGEYGVAGAMITLYSGSTPVATQTTNTGGFYDFGSLDPGTYSVVVTPPPGYLLTLQDQGTDPTKQSVVDQLTGISPSDTLDDNQSVKFNAGVYQPRVYVQPVTLKTVAAGATEDMVFPASLHVFPNQSIDSPVTIQYTTTDQSALSGTDYDSADGTTEFDPGPTQNTTASPPTVTLLGTDVLAPDKVFLLNLTSDDNSADIVDPTVTATIVASAADPITVDTSKANVTETPSGVVAYFSVQLAVAVDAPVMVDYTLGAIGDTATGATPAEIEAGTIKLNGVDYLVPSLSGVLTFPAGTTTQTIPVLVLDNFDAGAGLNVNNPLTRTFSLDLTGAADPGSMMTLSIPQPINTATITDDQVQNLNITGTGTTYTDNSGNKVTITLSGPGTAAVQKRGGENSDGIRIVLSGTNHTSVLNISSTGQTDISEIDDTAPLGAINASRVNLTGSMLLQGGLSKLSLNSITPTNLTEVPGITLAPGVQITIGGGPLGKVITLKAKVGRVTDTTFDLGIPIANMKAASFNNQNGEPSQIFAPTIGSLIVAGNFDENIQTNSISKLNVGGTIENSNIRAVVSIGSVVAGSLINSLVFAGITSATTSLPTSDSAFTAGTSIKSVKLRGKSAVFANSSIAAAIVGPLNLANVQPASDVPYFGVAGLELISVKGSTGTLFSIPKETADLGTVFSDQHFLIQVYGI